MTHGSIDQVMQLALQNHQAGRLADAEKIYRQVLARQPNQPDALHLLGTIAAQVGRWDMAVELIRRAIAINPVSASYNNSLGNALRGKEMLAEAITAYSQALRLKPDYASAHNNLASALRDKGQLQEAIAAYRRAVLFDPNLAEAHNSLGSALRDNRQFDDAISASRQAVQLKPDFVDAQINLGNALRDNGQIDEAITAYHHAIRIKPDFAQAHYNLGVALYDQGHLDEAIAAYGQALRLKSDYADAYTNMGNALRDKGQFDEALAAYRQALRLKPDLAEAHGNLAIILKDMGQLDEAITACDQAMALKPDSASFHSNLLLIMHYQEHSNPRELAAQSLRWARRYGDPLGHLGTAHANNRAPDRRLKIGYVSPDFGDHPVGRYLLPLLAAHDPEKVEIFCYAQVARSDAVTLQIRGYAHQWRDILRLTDEQAAEQIHRDRIDILVDLAGHTGGNRLLVFARKPAPVQVTWLGYPNTTGLAAMDYRLTDSWADPPGTSDALCRERLIRLPHSAWCYQAPAQSPPLDDSKTVDARPITFGSFNNFSKVTPSMLELWAQILRSTPGSRLLLKAKALSSQTVQQQVRRIMEAGGVASERLELQGWRQSTDEHLTSYRQVDVALDTFPYHGTTTTCEALWMCVPVVTQAGATHVSRVGVSLLSNVGLPELIALDPSEYVRLAVDLAKDAHRLNNLRSGLRQRMLHSPLMDAPRFARDVEAAYRQVWRNWCMSGPEG
jgi:protein O-GlcNAc transferase